MNQNQDQLSLNIGLDDYVSLDKFIHCNSTQDFLYYLKSTISDDSISNLYFIWGGQGVGKSYLMQALNREFISLGKKTFHMSLRDNRITSPEVFQNLESMDVVLIENIDNLQKHEDWESEIFKLLNSALTGQTKIYLSSRLVAKDLGVLLKDLESRLSYCTAVEVPEITQEEKIEALKQSSLRKGITLDIKTIQYIVNNTSRSLSDLLQLMNDMDNFSLKRKKKVSPALIREFLQLKASSSHK